MPAINHTADFAKTTDHKLVLPFYLYAALSFLMATILLLLSTNAFTRHYFHPHVLAITHAMALGWGTMIILGASHQLIPVLIETSLYSNKLGYASFVLAAIGIPLLVYGFYVFNLGWPARCGGILISAAILCYLINIGVSMTKSKNENVHAFFVFTATLWLLLTTIVGLLLIYNFTLSILPVDSLHYLPLHAHMGIVGWFLLLIVGVGSRMVPMFLLSKYTNTKLLWLIYCCINGGLVAFVLLFLYSHETALYLLPVSAVFTGIALFACYCYKCFQQRIRKKVDEQVKISLLSVLLIFLPLIFLLVFIARLMAGSVDIPVVMAYGFIIFFGWITAIILGMTFKTLPFIIWNKVYNKNAGTGKMPNPKELFNGGVFRAMAFVYLVGFILFIPGVLSANNLLLQTATLFLLAAALLYSWNVIKLLFHKSLPQ
ncbi:cytochrome C oxidase subunit I [Ferruginibacter paludis]|uniref:cytochrome C oxidase subunit I n=1 Tax=Ferruginibacter paludis TaxID=1310417 RepID=UPI0025B2EDBC|nr:cytochrome C oxidase subunit I [Ferruginibacter paludis]MDN3656336.1 cytochrome C oxidase subunit I [Ferruginibacter paludis]